MSVHEVASAGTSIWLDDLSRAKITGTDAHSLPSRIANSGVVGVTTNPSIFSAAISGAAEYATDIATLKNASVDEVVKKLTTDDVRQACDLFTAIYESSKGVDGRVSIEVDPRLAHDTEGTISAGKELWAIIDRPNLMIKVPATVEGLPAISALIAAGISVNVTLIFSVKRYGQVIDAYMNGIELCQDPSKVHSVASFFISRIDSSVDALLKKNGSPEATALLGKAAIANAHLCCGSAGVYNVLQPDLSQGLKERKLASINKAGADIVAAGNLGCINQLADVDAPICHTVQLLDWAYGGPTPSQLDKIINQS